MLLILVLILILIGATVVESIYSNFLIFYSNFAESENYHRAYYNSIAALERAELVTKQRSPGYIGSGGWKIGENEGAGSINKGGSDGIISNFSYLSNDESTQNTSTIFWDIKSRTSRIPATGEGDVELMLAYNDINNPDNPDNSNNYNMMDYENAQIFLLYYDNGLTSDGTNDNPYNKISCKKGDCQLSSPESITGKFRLPKYLRSSGFNELDTSTPLVGTGPSNDAIVDWQVRGNYDKSPFTIYSKQTIAGKIIYYNLDSAIRERNINDDSQTFTFGKDYRSPINDIDNITIISPNEGEIKDSFKDTKYKGLFNSSKTESPQIRFSLLNLLKDTDNKLYPFLEYYADFGTDVADKYFTINAEGNYADYKVNILIWKPTTKESVIGNFTSIF